MRRLDFVIGFPFPEAEDCRRIWQLVIPSEAPKASDVDLDFLAERFKLSSGSIRNCSLAATFEAADADTPIAMEHLVRAVAVEYSKQGRLTLESDFGTYHFLLGDTLARPPEPAPPRRPDPVVPPPPPERDRRIIRSRVEEL